MKKICLTLFCLFLCIGLAGCDALDFSGGDTSPDSQDKTGLSWTGTWDTEFSIGDDVYNSEMFLSQTQESVTGTYGYNYVEGTIDGSSEGLVLTGISMEGEYEYPIEFEMDPSGDSFTGTWYESEDDLEPAGEWNGTRR